MDDHQIQLIGQFNNLGFIYACEDMDLEKAIKVVRETEYKRYESNNEGIIRSLEEFIEG